jgi:N-acetylglucosamine-6-sulfatase
LRGIWPDCYNDNGQERCYTGEHPDAVIKDRVVSFVRERAPKPRPFFLWASFSAPHYRAYYQDRYEDDFTHTSLPQPPSLNEADVSDKPAWVRERPRLTQGEISEMEDVYRNRLRFLKTVDRVVARVVEKLEAARELDNTYIFLRTDNGYQLGEHRLPHGKNVPYSESVSFPLIVRGPDVAEGARRDELILNTDLAPTMAGLGGATTPGFVDGRSFAALLRGEDVPWRDAVLIESPATDKMGIPAYAGVRTARYSYTEYETGDRELYDLQADPYQLQNVADSGGSEALVAEFDARLEALKDCAGESCRRAENGLS